MKRRRLAALALSGLLVAVVFACGGRPPEPRPLGQASPSSASVSRTPSPDPTPSPRVMPHVFVIVMENTALARALASPPIARLASANTLLHVGSGGAPH